MTDTVAGPTEEAGDYDVVVVGAGPVGLSTAILLGRRGRRVAVLERWPEPYPRPRAAHFDDETARLLAGTGIAPDDPAHHEPADAYEWRNATGQTLLHFDYSGPGRSGWPRATMFHQPDLERSLEEVAATLETVTVLRGHEVVGLDDRGDQVELTIAAGGTTHRLRGSWVVGCDGANSTVREHMATPMVDQGFFYDWLILDVIPHEPRAWHPTNVQICDPARPTTLVSGGPGRRRWEFMRMPGESVAELDTDATAWRLLDRWDLGPDNATIERHTVYTFQARWAERWRDGRLLLAGDAAHLMPPFAGQGMCSGIRDAANLAWKLDLVLAGDAGASLLDTYTDERRAHVQHAIAMSVELGKIICVTDHDAATERDAAMLAKSADPARVLPRLPPPILTTGLLHRAPDGSPARHAGLLTPQARITRGGHTGLLDDVVGSGRFVVATRADPAAALPAHQRDLLRRIGAITVQLVPADAPAGHAGDHAAVDVDGFYLPYLDECDAVGLVIRPDHYLFGVATDATELAAQIDDLGAQLQSSHGPSPTAPPSARPTEEPTS